MLNALKAKLPGAKFHQVESSTIEATMGREFFGKCIVAIVLASVLMMVYVAIRFRKIGGWSAGLIALLALINDVLIAYFVFVIIRIELDDNFVAVVLSVLSYSLNGTIVIYDHIRENRRLAPRAPLGDVVNLSINQSFRRTLNSSITTFTAVACITVVALLYGLESLLSFSVPMMFGIVSGFYTSTFLAAPLWVWMKDLLAARAAAKAAAQAEAKKAKKHKK
jgi:preprotein translocase subunit SecF